jgi:hypothetical protein
MARFPDAPAQRNPKGGDERSRRLGAQIAQLEARLGPTGDMIAAFDAELAQMGRTLNT